MLDRFERVAWLPGALAGRQNGPDRVEPRIDLAGRLRERWR
jgi:hypothetical protein